MVTEEDFERINKRGPNDLEEMNNRKQDIIIALKAEKEELQKRLEFLQGKCRQAGKAILDLELNNSGLKKEIDRLAEENSNLMIMMGKRKNGKE
mgnify:CR=1 FL=1|jgi:predicted nuclease with TOPRIM domain|tara:strand:+ start:201 stop:482 length:282 start_codon:yes stop_codon:yes gene_type:complete